MHLWVHACVQVCEEAHVWVSKCLLVSVCACLRSPAQERPTVSEGIAVLTDLKRFENLLVTMGAYAQV